MLRIFRRLSLYESSGAIVSRTPGIVISTNAGPQEFVHVLLRSIRQMSPKQKRELRNAILAGAGISTRKRKRQ
jgi:hypothetical protein